MLVYQSQGRIPEEKLGYDQESNILLAVECLLEDVTSITVSRKVDDTSSVHNRVTFNEKDCRKSEPHAVDYLPPFLGGCRRFETSLDRPVAKTRGPRRSTSV